MELTKKSKENLANMVKAQMPALFERSNAFEAQKREVENSERTLTAKKEHLERLASDYETNLSGILDMIRISEMPVNLTSPYSVGISIGLSPEDYPDRDLWKAEIDRLTKDIYAALTRK